MQPTLGKGKDKTIAAWSGDEMDSWQMPQCEASNEWKIITRNPYDIYKSWLEKKSIGYSNTKLCNVTECKKKKKKTSSQNWIQVHHHKEKQTTN